MSVNTLSTRTPMSEKLVILLCASAMMVSVVSGATLCPALCTAAEPGHYLYSIRQTVIHVHPRMRWCHRLRLARLRVV